jgi:hypothetical protein
VDEDPVEARLDQALEATFPASDPIAVSLTHEQIPGDSSFCGSRVATERSI